MWLTTLWHEPNSAALWLIVSFGALVGGACDVWNRRIPNWLTMPLWITGMIMAMTRHGAPGTIDALFGSAIMALPYVLLFLFANGGAGDAKLMAAAGAWLGAINGLIALGAVAIFGVIVALVYAYRVHMTPDPVSEYAGQHDGGMQAKCADSEPLTIPYGVAIFLGIVVSAMGVLLWKM